MHSAKKSSFRRCRMGKSCGVTWSCSANVSQTLVYQFDIALFYKTPQMPWSSVSMLIMLDVLASQDQSGGDATVTIDQRKCQKLHSQLDSSSGFFLCATQKGAATSNTSSQLMTSLFHLIHSRADNSGSSQHAHSHQGAETESRPQSSTHFRRRAQLPWQPHR